MFRLDHQSLWIDEVFTWLSAAIHHPYGLADWLENLHGPLYGAIIHYWGALAGDSEWALRLPSAVFGTLSVPACAWLAHRWLGRETAAPAAWLAAASPFLVWYGQEARNYALLVTLSAAAGALLLTPGRRSLPAYVAVALAAVLTNFEILLLAPLHVRWALAGRRPRARHLAVAAIALAAVAAPWVPAAVRTLDWHRLHPTEAGDTGTPLRGVGSVSAGAVPFTLHAFAVGYSLGPPIRELRAGGASASVRRHAPELALVALVFAPLGAWGVMAVARRRRLLDLALWTLVPMAVTTWFAVRNFKVFHPRYLAVCAPAFLLVLAAGLVDLPPRLRRAAWVAIALVWAVSLRQHFFDPAYGKEDVRAAARFVDTHAAPGEVLVAAGTEDLLGYYHHGPQPVARVWLGWAGDPIRLERHLRETMTRRPGAWVVLARPEDLDPRGNFARLVDTRWPTAPSWRFEGVRVWHLDLGAEAPADTAGAAGADRLPPQGDRATRAGRRREGSA